MKKEIWKDIQDYENRYQVSNLGRIKSLERIVILRNGWIPKQKRKERILKNAVNPNGYMITTLYKLNKRKTCTIHRLVLMAFIGKSNLECNHKNGIKTDNRLENLEYCTPSENIQHAIKIGLRREKFGEDAKYSKLTEKQVLEIRKLYKTGKFTQKEIAKNYDITSENIGYIVNRKTWTHI